MAEQSFLAKLGLRLGVLGTSASLAFAAPIAAGNYSTDCHTDAARIGFYFDRTAAAEKIGYVVGGQIGPTYTRSGTVVDVLFTGQVRVGDGTTNATLRLNGAAGTERTLFYQSTGVNRWGVACNSTAEGGADAGSDYAISAYSDTGVLIDAPLVITRAAGGFITTTRRMTINTGAANANFLLNSNAGTNRVLGYQTAGSNRWQLVVNSTAESGSNAGSDFNLNAYDDTAVLIDQPMTIIRAALGVMTLSRPITHTAGTLTGSQVVMNTTATWNNGATTFTGWLLNITDSASNAASLLFDLQTGGATRFNIRKNGITVSTIVDTDLLATQSITYGRTSTLTGNVTDGVQISMSAVINGAFTVTRYNYIGVNTPTGTSTVTDGCVLRFNAAAGTHKAVDAASTKTSPGTVSAWMKHNINGTIFFQPLYTSKTS